MPDRWVSGPLAAVESGLEAFGLLDEGVGNAHEFVLGLGCLVIQAVDFTDLPVAEERLHDLLGMDAQVVDAGPGDLDRPALEVGNLGAGHREVAQHPAQ